MLKNIKSKLGFIYRGLIGIKDNLFDNPKIDNKVLKKHKFSIGKTIENEEIYCYKFGSGENKILYFGGIHGNEVGTVKLMKHWINYLCEKLGRVDLLSLQDTQVFIIPCLNIDGYKKALQRREYFSGGRYGKANAGEVDLNRNFPTSNWSQKSTLFAAGEYFEISGGTSPGSEPEIEALLGLIEKERIQTIYTFHNCWGTVFGRGTKSVAEKVENYSEKSGYRIFEDSEFNSLEDGQKTGQMMIWAEEQGIDVIEVEMRTRWGSEWIKNREALRDSLCIGEEKI